MRLHSVGNFDVIIKERHYYQEHEEERKLYQKEYGHRSEAKIIRRKTVNKYRQSHPEIVRGREKKHEAKRRKLGFISFNEPFKGSHAHHIDFECVIYIPKELHRSVYHNVWTSEGMTEINDKIFEWLDTPT